MFLPTLVYNDELERSWLIVHESPEWRLVTYFHDNSHDKVSYHFVNHYFVV